MDVAGESEFAGNVCGRFGWCDVIGEDVVGLVS